MELQEEWEGCDLSPQMSQSRAGVPDFWAGCPISRIFCEKWESDIEQKLKIFVEP
jgi:hypothetical protein